MKIKVLLLSLVSFVAINLFAQAPQKFSFQSVIRNSNNALVTNQLVGVRMSILQGSISGSVQYIETQYASTNQNGLLTLEVGSGTVVTGSIAAINWANGPFFIKAETDPTGGNNYTISGTTQMLSVPYALHAKTAESLSGTNVPPTHYIGELYGGGVVFAVYKDATGTEHGLIVSLNDLSSGSEWGPQVNVPNCQSSYNGQTNTAAAILVGAAPATAISLCDNYTGGGQTDWYLPSIQELDMIWNNFHILNKILQVTAGANEIGNYQYWSSTQFETSSSYQYSFFYSSSPTQIVSTLGIGMTSKVVTLRVRAVRQF